MERSEDVGDDPARRAPELDGNALALEFYPAEEGLQVNQENNGFQTIPNKSEPYIAELATSIPQAKRKISRLKIVLVSLALSIAILAIALGIGLGVGLKRSVSSSDLPDPTHSSLPIATPSPKNAILNDTSLAAITTSDGNKHLFFQDLNGSIRHTSFDVSSKSWATSPQFVETEIAPRNLTPLAVVEIEQSTSATQSPTMEVLYIAFNNTLMDVIYGFTVSQYLSRGSLLNGSFSVAPDTRSLTVAQTKNIPSASEFNTTAEVVLLYEAPNHNITTLHGSINTDAGIENLGGWSWVNVSDSVYSAIRNKSDTWLSPPIASHVLSLDDSSPQSPQAVETSVCIAYFNTNALSNASAAPVYLATFDDWSGTEPNPSQIAVGLNAYEQNNATVAVSQSDMISYFYEVSSGSNDPSALEGGSPGQNGFNPWAAAWVQNQSLLFPTFRTKGLATPYPFSRLAWLNDSLAGGVYIYHQLTDSVLVEDVYLDSTGWISTNITIGTST